MTCNFYSFFPLVKFVLENLNYFLAVGIGGSFEFFRYFSFGYLTKTPARNGYTEEFEGEPALEPKQKRSFRKSKIIGNFFRLVNELLGETLSWIQGDLCHNPVS